MYKIKRKSFLILFILVILSFAVLLNEIIKSEKEKKTYNITVITESEINENSIIMKSGAEKAAEQMNAEIRFVTLSKDDFVEEQKELLRSENNSNTDAILIVPIRYKDLKGTIENVNKNIPVILLDSYLDQNNEINSVIFDNYNMGIDMGNEILNSLSDGQKVVIVKDNLNLDVVEQRCKGIISVMKDKVQYDIVEFKKDKNSTYYDEVKELITNNKGNVVVSFNSDILEIIAQVKSELLNTNTDIDKIKLYGSGNTRKIISFLDQNIINGIVLENQFNIGYLGVKNAINIIKNNENKSDIISSKIITRDNMYSSENQRLLFLFIR